MDDSLAQDLISMWQSELNAMAADREVRESWAMLVALWAQTSQFALAQLRHDAPAGSTRAVEPAGAAPADAASQPRLDEVRQLERRIAELEQRLAGFMADGGNGGPGGAESGD